MFRSADAWLVVELWRTNICAEMRRGEHPANRMGRSQNEMTENGKTIGPIVSLSRLVLLVSSRQ